MMHQEKWYKNLDSDIPPNLSAWLLHAGSFMDRLKNHGILDAKIEMVDELWSQPFTDEKEILSISDTALVREVWIKSEGKCWMFARTVIPRIYLKGKFCQCQNLNTRPIGSVLFHDKNIVRGEFEFRCVDPTFDLYDKVQHYIQDSKIYARRSMFNAVKESLLLTEVFMPDILLL